MPGPGDFLTLPAPKILEGNAVDIIEIDEWVFAPFSTAIGSSEIRPAFPLIGARAGSTGLEQSASGDAIGPSESCFHVQRKCLVEDRVSEALDVRI